METRQQAVASLRDALSNISSLVESIRSNWASKWPVIDDGNARATLKTERNRQRAQSPLQVQYRLDLSGTYPGIDELVDGGAEHLVHDLEESLTRAERSAGMLLSDNPASQVAEYLRQQRAAVKDIKRAKTVEDLCLIEFSEITLGFMEGELDRLEVELAESDANESSIEGKEASRDGLEPFRTKANSEALHSLPPRFRSAYKAYLIAEAGLETTDITDVEAYDWLTEYEFSNSSDQDLMNYRLPTKLSTWSKYLRDARNKLGTSKYTKRTDRPLGRSVVRQSDI